MQKYAKFSAVTLLHLKCQVFCLPSVPLIVTKRLVRNNGGDPAEVSDIMSASVKRKIKKNPQTTQQVVHGKRRDS